MTEFATGKYVKAECDRCGFIVPYRELREEIERDQPTGVFVCADCFDPDHPHDEYRIQQQFPVYDPQALKHPRPQRLPED